MWITKSIGQTFLTNMYSHAQKEASLSFLWYKETNKQTGHLLVSDYHGPWTPATQESQVRWRLKIPSFFFVDRVNHPFGGSLVLESEEGLR